MKKHITIAAILFSLSVSAFAQTTAATQQQSANSAASNTGNNQTSIYNSPADTRAVVTYAYGDQTIKNTPSMGLPSLTTSNDTCMGSTSGGISGPGVGISLGSTWSDEHCKRLKMSRELWNKGMRAASMAIDCMNADAKLALEITGTKCPQSMTADERKEAYGPLASSEGAALRLSKSMTTQPTEQGPSGFEGANMADPFIAARANKQ